MSDNQPILEVRNLKKYFGGTSGVLKRPAPPVKAIDDVSFSIDSGEVFGLVGESGSGKTTIGRTILRLIEPTAGEILFRGKDITTASPNELQTFRREVQPIFQDPYASLNPRMRVQELIAEPLVIHGMHKNRKARRDRVVELLETVGLQAAHLRRYPHEFSGGQRQRIGIARALAVEPKLIVADEAVSALDVSIQVQIVNLMLDLKERLGLTILFIAHDLALVEYVSDRIATMYLGRLMEVGPSRALCSTPKHPYTEALLSAVPVPDTRHDRKRIVLEGDIPSPINPPSGCVFRTRCPYAVDACAQAVPELTGVSADHFKACIRDDIL